MCRGISKRFYSLQEMDQQLSDCILAWYDQQYCLQLLQSIKTSLLLRAMKLTIDNPSILKIVVLSVELLGDHLAYFAIVKIPLGLLTAKCIVLSSRLST